MTRKEKLKAWAVGNVILLAVVGTANLVSFSVAGYALRVRYEWFPEMTEGQVRAAQYVLDRGLSDPEELPREPVKNSRKG